MFFFFVAYALLLQLTTSAAVQQAIAQTIEPGMLLSVGWCTHKYKHTEDGERQQAKGSGKRTHFYLLACREHAETSAGQELQPSLCLGHAYHTTMWFEGTYTPRGSSCLSSRLLVTWNQRVPNVFLEHLEDAWRQLPSGPNRKVVFQPPFFSGELLNFGGVLRLMSL